jgi:glutathione S-transferase
VITLCGFAASNYYNKVKFALLEKDVAFQEQLVYPSGDSDFAMHSPMRKVPYLATPEGSIYESQPIAEYLEEAFPAIPLYPASLHERASCRSLIQLIELYLEWPARRTYSAAMFGGERDEAVIREVETHLRRGLRALAAVARFSPYICGDRFTLADVAAAVHFPTITGATKAIYGHDVFDAIPAVKPYLAMIRERPHYQRINADRKANLEPFTAYVTAKRK